MPVVATARIDRQAVTRLVQGRGSPVYDAVQRGTNRARDRAKIEVTAAGRVDTGYLRNQIQSDVRVTGSRVIGKVTSHAPYSRFVHGGTGIYGPRGRPIVPRRARYLRFKPKGSATFVFTKSVKGMRPTPFMQRALDKVSIRDFL